MISRDTIDKVYETAKVEEVISDFVSLKKAGSNYKALSPFTKEKTPSFMVSPVKQIWKDFSSGKGGNVVAFLMEHEHLSYPEAIRYLAKKYSIEIEETRQTEYEKSQNNDRESLYLISKFACEFFEKCLWNTEEGKSIGITYFKERGFDDETIKNFRLGYSPEQNDAFSSIALKKGYNDNYIIRSGLVIDNIKRKNKIDRFRGRVIFPIRSLSGRVQGFGGRILKKNLKAAKYINSPESEIYSKSKVLYGFYEAKKSIAKEDCCYLVEGYTDVIQLHQSGISNSVSSSGTALTYDQIRLIKRLTLNIIVLFDSDPSGIKAALRGVDLILEQGLKVRICVFPEGEDPDSFAKNNSPSFLKNFLEDNTKDFIQFKANLLTKESINDPIKKTSIVRDIIHSISKIPDLIQQEFYLKSCSEIMGVSERVLFSVLAQEKNQFIRNKNFRQKNVLPNRIHKTESTKHIDNSYNLEKQIISILLQFGHLEAEYEEVVLKTNENGEITESFENIKAKVFEKIFLDLQQDEVELADPNFRNLFHRLISAFQVKGDLAINSMLFKEKNDLNTIITDLLMDAEKYFLHSWDTKNIFVKSKTDELGQLVTETILTLRKNLINEKINKLKSQLSSGDKNHKDLLEDIINYNRLKKTLSKKLNRVI